MSLPLRLLPKARFEYDEAADWYEACGVGLGIDFIARVRAVFHRITATPRIHGKVMGNVRKANVSRFPYIVLYEEFDDEVLVIAVFHTSRDPKEWARRV
ncbi:MAG: type II toxin-antitoxin system RelE/ParE family toxin [Sphingobium sp.]